MSGSRTEWRVSGDVLVGVQTHAIMGTNGSGKSTLSKCLVGHPDYEITGGTGRLSALLDMPSSVMAGLQWL